MRIYLDTQIWINACNGSTQALKEWLLSDERLGSHQFFFSSAIVAEVFDERYPEANQKRDDFIFQVTKGNCFVQHPRGRAGEIMRPLALLKRYISNPVSDDMFSKILASGLGSMSKYLEASAEAQGMTPPKYLAQMESSCVGRDMPDALTMFVGTMDNAPMRDITKKHGFAFGQFNHLNGYEFAQKLRESFPSESGDPIRQLMAFVSRYSPSGRELEFQMLVMPLVLDQFGYWSDKKEECQKRGRVFDQMHVVEAAFAEAFVSDDKRLRHRAQATYALLEHKTQVYSSSGMMERL